MGAARWGAIGTVSFFITARAALAQPGEFTSALARIDPPVLD
jgi:hypothetical protein